MKNILTQALTAATVLSLVIIALPARAESITPVCPSIAITRSLAFGSRDLYTGGDVSRLQAFLGISPTGYFGPITKAGVIKFQSDNSIAPAVGYVGPLTRAAIAKRCIVTPPSGVDISFSAAPTTGSAPLPVTFSASGSGLGRGQYVVDYGDGANSGPVPSYCVSVSGTASSSCNMTAGHTYTSPGVHTASLSPYVACLWTTPRCLLDTQLLGSATITVGKTATTSTLSIPGSTTLAPGTSATNKGAYFTYTLTANAVRLTPSVSADFTWSESHCGTSGCLGAADPAPQNFTLYLSSGNGSYTSALGHVITLTAVASNSATVDVPK
jgi:peptidoglycan hydrolase-like protein with peptidoglycan-binding domain